MVKSSDPLLQQVAEQLARLARDFLARRVDLGELVAPFLRPGGVDHHSGIGEVAHLALLRREPRVGWRAAHAA